MLASIEKMDSESQNRKKIDEHRILRYVFDPKTFKSYKHLDKPDFWIECDNQSVGVEVTQFYNSDSLARLEKIPNYIDDVLDDQRYKHKFDMDEIPVVNVILINDETNEQFQIKAIKLPNYDINHYLNQLAKSLEEKRILHKEYNKNLTHIDLIVSDETELLNYQDIDDFYDMVCKPNIRNLILESPFREIYLVSTISKFKYFYPLKLLIFYTHIYLFQEVILKLNSLPKEIDQFEYFNWAGEFLAQIGFQKLGLKILDNHIELICGQLSFHLKDFSKVVIRDYNNSSPGTNRDISQTNFFKDNIEHLIEGEAKDFRVKMNLCKKIED